MKRAGSSTLTPISTALLTTERPSRSASDLSQPAPSRPGAKITARALTSRPDSSVSPRTTPAWVSTDSTLVRVSTSTLPATHGAYFPELQNIACTHGEWGVQERSSHAWHVLPFLHMLGIVSEDGVGRPVCAPDTVHVGQQPPSSPWDTYSLNHPPAALTSACRRRRHPPPTPTLWRKAGEQ